MNREHRQTRLLTNFLLGEVSEADREHLEESYFTDAELFDRLLETENRLIRDYLSGDLGPHEKRLFEQRYLTSACGRQKLELHYLASRSEVAQSILGRKYTQVSSTGPSRLQSVLQVINSFRPLVWIPAAASLVAASIIAIFLFKQSQPGDAPATSSPADIAHSISPQPAGEPIIRLELEPAVLTRSRGSNPTVSKDAATRSVELKLKLLGKIYPKYQGQLLNLENRNAEIANEDSLVPEGDKKEKYVLWKLDSTILPVGDYLVELHGVTSSGDSGESSSYDFKVRGR